MLLLTFGFIVGLFWPLVQGYQGYTSSVSPLRAFKQLGFDDVSHSRNTYSSSSYGSFSYVDDKSPPAIPSKPSSIKHPNEILSNMGVELPSEQILGEFFFMKTSTLGAIFMSKTLAAARDTQRI